MIKLTTCIRVRYSEVDRMGYVYYGHYAQYFEVARVEFLRSMGISYKELENQGVLLPVLELRCKYHHPAKYDDLLHIEVFVEKLPGVRAHFRYEVYHEEGTLLCEAETVLVFVSAESRKPVRCPQDVYERMKACFIPS